MEATCNTVTRSICGYLSSSDSMSQDFALFEPGHPCRASEFSNSVILGCRPQRSRKYIIQEPSPSVKPSIDTSNSPEKRTTVTNLTSQTQNPNISSKMRPHLYSAILVFLAGQAFILPLEARNSGGPANAGRIDFEVHNVPNSNDLSANPKA